MQQKQSHAPFGPDDDAAADCVTHVTLDQVGFIVYSMVSFAKMDTSNYTELFKESNAIALLQGKSRVELLKAIEGGSNVSRWQGSLDLIAMRMQ